MTTQTIPVLIAGSGCVGLSLAHGLTRMGIETAVVEQPAAAAEHSKSVALLPATLEIFRQWSLLEQFQEEGKYLPTIRPWMVGEAKPRVSLDMERALGDLTPCAGVLALSQERTEAVLSRTLPADVVRPAHRLETFREKDDVVLARITPAEGKPYEMRCRYLVGADGPNSTVRELLGWELHGRTYPGRVLLVDVKLPDERGDLPWPRMACNGAVSGICLGERQWRIIATVEPALRDEEATSLHNVDRLVTALLGSGPFETLWKKVTRIHVRNSPKLRSGRIMLAGDAGHINSPAGGQGSNSGIQDAHNLAWKLARALRGGKADDLLASYEEERQYAITRYVDRFTDLLTRFVMFGPAWMRSIEWRLAPSAVRNRRMQRSLAQRLGMLDTRYPKSRLISGAGTLPGSRAPNGALQAPDGVRRRLHDLAYPNGALLLVDDGRCPSWSLLEMRALLTEVPDLAIHRVLTSSQAPDGEGALRDLSGLLPNEHGRALLVRPDGFIGWSEVRPLSGALRGAVKRSLGVL